MPEISRRQKTEKPLVSVIVSTHKRPHLLKETLSSILNQTYPHFEILVVSDGPSTENKNVIDVLSDDKIFYFECQQSGGPAAPRNYGLVRAKGTYLAFCDDDDLWTSDKLEKQIHCLEKHGEYGLCFSKMLRFDGNKKWFAPHEEGSADFESLLHFNTIPISSVVIRSSLVKKYGGFSEDLSLGVAEDYEFLLRHARNTKFYFCDEYLIQYRSGEARMTSETGMYYSWSYFLNMMHCYRMIWRASYISSAKFIFLATKASYTLMRKFLFHVKRMAKRKIIFLGH